jgi:hypothetical protein
MLEYLVGDGVKWAGIWMELEYNIWMELESKGLKYLVGAGIKWVGIFGLNRGGKGWNVWLELESVGLELFVGAGVKWPGIYGWAGIFFNKADIRCSIIFLFGGGVEWAEIFGLNWSGIFGWGWSQTGKMLLLELESVRRFIYLIIESCS